MAKKKRLTIWICEDDEGSWDFFRGALTRELPNPVLKFFPSGGHTYRATGSPDFVLLDVGAISVGTDTHALGIANIKGLTEEHPGVIVIVFSAIKIFARDIVEEVKEESKAVVFFSGYDFKQMTDIIKEWA